MSIGDRRRPAPRKSGKHGFNFPISGGDIKDGPEGHDRLTAAASRSSPRAARA